jgi:malic enzyme
MIDEKAALEYHAGGRPGKIELKGSKPCLSPREMRLAYLPGALAPARSIAADPAEVYTYTARGNLIALVTNGTAVPGLGDVGPLAAKPVQEGLALLFKRLADLDAFDLELDTRDPDRFVETVRTVAPSFGGINLHDISLPAGLDIYDRLRDALPVPVFHENLYGLAIVVVAAVINALDLVDKRVEDVRLVVSGAGTVGLGLPRLLTALGIQPRNVLLYDRDGLVHPGRADLSPTTCVGTGQRGAHHRAGDPRRGRLPGRLRRGRSLRRDDPLHGGQAHRHRPRGTGAGDRLSGPRGPRATTWWCLPAVRPTPTPLSTSSARPTSSGAPSTHGRRASRRA